MRKIIYLVTFLSLVSCSYFQTEEPIRPTADLLTEDYAKLRHKWVSDVHYNLKFDLSQRDQFHGTSQINFQLKKLFPLSVDFSGGKIKRIFINSKPVTQFHYNGFYIDIPEEHLVVGINSLSIEYSHPYSKTGAGLYQFKDVQDKKTYLYSDFEPYSANKMFPCFDQPNLKATFQTEVVVPQGWQVISSNRETMVNEVESQAQWIFPITEKFSTYTYSVHAGPYEMWEDNLKLKKREIPLRLFVRQSMKKYVNPEEWFGLTKQGMPFFEKYFSTPFPYSKYDQVIVPDLNHGAMENVAAVTFSEDRFVPRGEKNRNISRYLALTLFHEMAHMWFGNLVTLNWWDDLWLNESFATFASYVGVVEVTEYKESWSTFNTYAKTQAYIADQGLNTHPVAMTVPNTEKASSSFDGISYGKGASILRQLAFLTGERDFKKSLKYYFKKHREGNTTLADFLEAFGKHTAMDVKTWEDRWFRTPMLNHLEAFFTCKNGRIKQFEIFQIGTKEYPTLRTHKVKVALFKRAGGEYKLNRSINVTVKGERTEVAKLKGKLCPDIVYPNFKDYGYLRVHLDRRSLKNIVTSLSEVKDDFLRDILWSDLWQMVLNKKLDLNHYLEVVEFNALSEQNKDILNKVLLQVRLILKAYYPRDSDYWEGKRQVWLKFFEQSFLAKVTQIEDEGLQKLWFKSLVSIAESPEVHKEFVRLLKGHWKRLPLQFKLDQDLRWELVASLMTYGHPEAHNLLAREVKRDRTKQGELQALYVRTLEPNLEKKKEYLAQVVNADGEQSLGEARTILQGIGIEGQPEIRKELSKTFFKDLKNISQKRGELFVLTYAKVMAPVVCDSRNQFKLNAYIQGEKGLPYGVVKQLRGALNEDQRCLGMRQALKSSGGLGREIKTL